MEYKLKVLYTKDVTHNVRSFRIEKPKDFNFTPGQATDLSILKPGWEKEKRPFTFTSLPEEDTLEFTIKMYADRNGVTKQLKNIVAGDAVEISDAWGAIEYKGEGTFIAGGAGITPFICILRSLYKTADVANNKLIFSNKTESDIILHDELKKILGSNLINIITDEPGTKYFKGRINKQFLQQHISNFGQHFYVCGPDEFTAAMLDILKQSGATADTLVFEK